MSKELTDQEISRRNKLKNLIDEGINPFLIQNFKRNYNSLSFKKDFEKFTKEELHENKTEILIAGRIIAIRQTFGVIKDFYGKTQFYINKKNIDQKY
jgi:lysyl-tRNA synthetase class 2